MSIYITGDKHGELVSKVSKSFCKKYKQPYLQPKDILIVTGDFGLVWDNNSYKQINYTQKYLERRDITVFSVLGNHENYDIIEQLPQVDMHGNKCYKISENMYFLQNGALYNIDGYKFAVFGGALSTDKIYRKEGKSWWSQEIPSKETMQYFVDNLDKVDTEDYILLTHTTNSTMVSKLLWHDNPRVGDDVAQFLEFIKLQYEFKYHYFGHFHENINMSSSKAILLYNDIVKIE